MYTIDNAVYVLPWREVIAMFENNDFDLCDFDLDLQIKSNINIEESGISSQSLCTPGCGNTGTGNSFCC